MQILLWCYCDAGLLLLLLPAAGGLLPVRQSASGTT